MHKRILCTGSRGFIGSKVVARLKQLGHEVIGYDIVDGDDLLDLKKLEEVVKTVDIVMHIAAQADLTQMAVSVEAGRAGVLANTEATHNVAYACAKHGKWLIYASTVCVYGNLKKHPAKEDETLPNPSDLYAASKYAGEWLIKGYGQNHGMPWTILRFATIYGPGMREALGMHVFFRQALAGEPITVHGDGKQDRTLTYIDDLVEGIVAPLNNPGKATDQVFNLTSDTPVSALKMAQDVQRITNSTSTITFIPQRANQTIHEDFDTSKANRELEWRAQTSWEDGLTRTLKWFKETRLEKAVKAVNHRHAKIEKRKEENHDLELAE